MKKIILIFLTVLCLSAFPFTTLAADSITINVSKTAAVAGDELTVSGTAAASTWISLKGNRTPKEIFCISVLCSPTPRALTARPLRCPL